MILTSSTPDWITFGMVVEVIMEAILIFHLCRRKLLLKSFYKFADDYSYFTIIYYAMV